MKSKYLNAVSAVMYFICAVATVCLILPAFTDFHCSHSEKFVTGLIIFVLGFTASKFRCLASSSEKAVLIMKKTLIWLFAVYIFIVIDFTLISDSFGRNISNIFMLDSEQLRLYVSQKVNFIPFKTVKLFISAYNSGVLKPYIVLENILGNIFVFMPFALFLPIVFTRIDSVVKFLICISVSVVVIELLQLLFLTGSADIDDFILNVSGAASAYGILKIRGVKRAVNTFIFGKKQGEDLEGKS